MRAPIAVYPVSWFRSAGVPTKISTIAVLAGSFGTRNEATADPPSADGGDAFMRLRLSISPEFVP